MIVLAVPTHRFRELPPDLFAGKILVDAMNYWEPVDGGDPELAAAPTARAWSSRSASRPRGWSRASTSSATTSSTSSAAPRRARPHRRSPRPATTGWPSATVMRLIDRLGFDPVDAGPLENGAGAGARRVAVRRHLQRRRARERLRAA